MVALYSKREGWNRSYNYCDTQDWIRRSRAKNGKQTEILQFFYQLKISFMFVRLHVLQYSLLFLLHLFLFGLFVSVRAIIFFDFILCINYQVFFGAFISFCLFRSQLKVYV